MGLNKSSIVKAKVHAITDVGMVRDHNEDNFIVCPDLSLSNWFVTDDSFEVSKLGCLCVLADGMGGAKAGEVASELAVESVKRFFEEKFTEYKTSFPPDELLKDAIMSAHSSLLGSIEQNSELDGMGTTIVLLWLRESMAYISWSGDSRAYLQRQGEKIKILTKDHSVVWDMVEEGTLTSDEADKHPDNNIITQCLGFKDQVPIPDVISLKIRKGDRILLCSDGLNNMVASNDIQNQLSNKEESLESVNSSLVNLANKNGGEDNITIITLEIIQGLKNGISGKWVAFILVPIMFVLFIYSTDVLNSFRASDDKDLSAEESFEKPLINNESTLLNAESDKLLVSESDTDYELLKDSLKVLFLQTSKRLELDSPSFSSDSIVKQFQLNNPDSLPSFMQAVSAMDTAELKIVHERLKYLNIRLDSLQETKLKLDSNNHENKD